VPWRSLRRHSVPALAALGLVLLGGLAGGLAALAPLWDAPLPVVALLGVAAALLAAAGAVVEALRPEEELPAGGQPAPATGRHELPAGPTGFVGRRADIARALRDLRPRDDEAPLLFITGAPGVGKTALALVLAHQLALKEYRGQQLFCSLDQRRPLTAKQALYGRLLALGVPGQDIPADRAGRQSLYVHKLEDQRRQGQRALVVLDDATTADQVRALWPPNGCAAIVTGPAELLEILRDGGQPLRLQPLTTLESLRFLSNRIGWRRVAREPLAALGIVRACGRLPLALACVSASLVAARGRYLLLRRVARRLRDRRTRLSDLSAGEHEGVEPALALSYSGLTHEERRVFDVIGHLDAPELDAELVAAVVLCSREEAEGLLAALVDKGLLEVAGPPGDRFVSHDLVRLFACQVAPPEERQAAVERAVDFHLQRVRRLEDLLKRPLSELAPEEAAAARALLQRERAAGRALVDRAASTGLDLTAALVGELISLLHIAVTAWPDSPAAVERPQPATTGRAGALRLISQVPGPLRKRWRSVPPRRHVPQGRAHDGWLSQLRSLLGYPAPPPASPPAGFVEVSGTFGGRGFGAREPVQLFAGGRQVGGTRSGRDGSFTAGASLGWHRPGTVLLVQAVGRRSGAMAFCTVTA
jgi:hypothetical protein